MDLEDWKTFSISTLNYGCLLFIHKIIHILFCSILPSCFIRESSPKVKSPKSRYRYILNQQLQTNQSNSPTVSQNVTVKMAIAQRNCKGNREGKQSA